MPHIKPQLSKLTCAISYLPSLAEELSAAFFPGGPEAWAPHPLAAYPELAPSAAAAIHHTALIQHPALAQVPVRVSYQNLFTIYCTGAKRSHDCVYMHFHGYCHLILIICINRLNYRFCHILLHVLP